MSFKNTPTEEVLPATDDQIGHIKELSDKVLHTLTSEEANAIIQNRGVYIDNYNKMLQHVLVDLTITFTVIVKSVDYTRDPHEVIDATEYVKHLDDGIVVTMPRRDGIHENVKNVEVVFFKLDGTVYDIKNVEREYTLRGLVPDPYAQAAANEQDSSLADSKPNGTYWNPDGNVNSYLVFSRRGDVHGVRCRRDSSVWFDDCWFVGVLKS